MASENETVAEIVRDMNCSHEGMIAFEFQNYASRIEAAHKREVAELRECLKDAIDMTCDNNGSCNDCPFFWNHNDCKVARWRKALEGENNEDK